MKRSHSLLLGFAALALLAAGGFAYLISGEPHGPVPPIVAPGGVGFSKPSDAIVLFDGLDLAVLGETVKTQENFKDFQLHLEWRSEGPQAKSSLLLAAPNYALQLGERPGWIDGRPPLVQAARRPGDWQTYDLIWAAPRFAPDGSPQTPARLTLFLNGVLVQNGARLPGQVAYQSSPIGLVRGSDPHRLVFRNMWVRRL